MDPMLFILELVRAIAWPAAVVGIVYIAKLVLDKIEIRDPDDKLPDAKPPARPVAPRVQVRSPPSPRPDETPTGR